MTKDEKEIIHLLAKKVINIQEQLNLLVENLCTILSSGISASSPNPKLNWSVVNAVAVSWCIFDSIKWVSEPASFLVSQFDIWLLM